MNNFPVIVDGKEHWISRSVAVSGFIFTYDNGLRVLVGKRGRGCPDNVGLWNVPSGYLDWDESTKEATSREIKEETNLTVNPESLLFYNINDIPKGKQNITFNYWSFREDYAGQTVYAKGFELDEVEDVKWIGMDELDNYEWAYSQKYLIRSIALDYLGKYLPKEVRKKFKLMQNN